MVDAARLAIRQTASELPRWAVEVDVRDASAANGIWDVDAEVTNALTAIGTQGTIAYMGPVDSYATATSIPIACVAKMAYVSPASVAPGLTRPTDADPHVVPTAPRLDCEPTFVRVIANDTSIGQALATRARIRALPRAYLIVQDGYLGDIIGDSFIDAHAELGGSIVGTLRSDGPTVADDAAARDVASLKPDVIVHVAAFSDDTVPLWKALEGAIPGTPILSIDTIWRPEFLDLVGSAGVGTEFVDTEVDPLARTDNGFALSFRNAYDREPSFDAAYAYDAARVVLDALRRVPADITSPLDVREALPALVAATRIVSTIDGVIKFDDVGDLTTQPIGLYAIDVEGDPPYVKTTMQLVPRQR